MKIKDIKKFIECTLSEIEKTKKDYTVQSPIGFKLNLDNQIITFEVIKKKNGI